MPVRWTDSLCEPLATALRDGVWNRIEEARDGGWLALAEGPGGETVHWTRITPEGQRLADGLDVLADDRLPVIPGLVSGWLRSGFGIRALSYKVGKRAIFEIHSGGQPCIAKVYRKTTQLERRWTSLPSRPTGRWRIPRVIDWDANRGVLVMEHCPHPSLNRRWLGGKAVAEDGDRVADLLQWLATNPIPAGFPTHTAEDECRILTQRLPVFQRILATPPGQAATLTDAVVTALADEPPAPPVWTHRDLHDKQILLGPAQGVVIDLDLAAAAAPALDVGNILAHLRLRELKGARIPWTEIAGRIAEARRDRVTARSLGRWTAATLLRLALIYSRRRREPTLLENLLSSTAQALERAGEWKCIL